MDGLARLKAESRRFKEELSSIRTRQLEPDEVSETSAWDSPHTLGQLVSDLQKSTEGNPNIVHSSSTNSGGPVVVPNVPPLISKSNSTLPVTREYSVSTPDSATVSDRIVSARGFPGTNSDQGQTTQTSTTNIDVQKGSIVLQDQDKKDVTRITATAVFTANGGKLVLSAPRSLPGASGKQSPSLPEAENDKLSHEMHGLIQARDPKISDQRNDSMAINTASGKGIGWRNTTTVSFANDLAHVCTESVICRQNAGVEHIRSTREELRECIKTRLDGEASGNSTRRPCLDEASGSYSTSCFDERVKSVLHSPTENPSRKDSMLAKRMATRIKHILQSIGFGKDSPVKERDLKNMIGSCTESTLKNWDIRNMISSCQAARNAYSKGLLDAVCCPDNSGDNVIKQKPPATCIPDPELYLENVVSALQRKRGYCDELSAEDPSPETITEPYASDITFLEDMPASKTTQGTQATCEVNSGTQTIMEKAREIDVKSQEPSEKMACKQMVTEGIQTDPAVDVGSYFPPKDVTLETSLALHTQNCEETQRDLVQSDSLSVDQLIIAEATYKSLNDNKGMQSATVVKRHSSNQRMSRHEPDWRPIQITKSIELPGPSSVATHNPCSNQLKKKKKAVQVTNQSIVDLSDNGDLTVRQISSHRSVLDFPVEAAVQAASELTKNLADGVTTKVVSNKAQKLNDCQLERKKSAAKAVQALVGEDFDYGSMYQDLKMLQMERRKLEIRAKTTIELQVLPKDQQTVNKKDCSSKDQLLRRKPEVKEPSTSVKRQRTTKSPIENDFVTKPPKPFKWKHSPLHNRCHVPFLASSLDISMDDKMNVGIQQNVTAHILKKLQDCRKAQRRKAQNKVDAPNLLESKKKQFPVAAPAWVERMTRGRPSHEVNEFQKRESSGAIQSKNLVTRKSVRPPGTIFKSSTPITWEADCNQVKNLNLNATVVINANCPGTSNTKHKNKIKNVNVAGPSKSPRVDLCDEIEAFNAGDLIANVSDGFAAITENLDLEMSAIEQQREIAWIQEECNKPCEDTTTNAPKSDRKGYLESLLNNVLRNIPEEPVENTETFGNMFSVYTDPLDAALDVSPEPCSPKDDDDYKKLLENEVGRDALLAITLQTILNDQSDCDTNDDVREEYISHQITTGSLLVVNNMENDERKQDSKCVQTMETNPCPSGQVMFPSLQFIPACHGPDGNSLATPSLCYVPCAPGSYLRCACEKLPCSSSESDPCRKANRRPISNCKNVRHRRCNKRLQKKCYDSSSSLDTPSSPASIHEIEDICQTGFDYNNEATTSNVVPLQLPSYVSTTKERTPRKTTPRDTSTACEAPKLEPREIDGMVLPTESVIEQPRKESVLANRDCDLTLPATSKIEWEPELLEVARVVPLEPATASESRPFGGDKMQNTGKQTDSDMKSGPLIPSYWGVVGRPHSSRNKYVMDVPSWYEIKKPMKISSSSENLLTSSSDLSSVSSASLGELQQKAFAILRESMPTPRREETSENFENKTDTSVNLGDTSDGEIAMLKNPNKSHGLFALESMQHSNQEDSVELGEIFFPGRGSQSFSQGEASSQGELVLNEEDGELILNEEDGEIK